jgi:hypothetical protein
LSKIKEYKIDIDITDLKARELIKILNMYNSGHLEIKFERVFWCSDYSEPSMPTNPAEVFDPRRPLPVSGQPTNPFERMGSVLGSMMGPPPRQR